MMAIEDKEFLIIAGQPKAGTTTLFTWLKQHPKITGSMLKETRFFLDQAYPLPCAARYNGHNLQAYAETFKNPHNQVLMEATPDYLYGDLALEIATLLPRAKVIVIKRDALSRMVSCYRFFQQRGDISQHMSFDEYIEKQAIGADLAQAPVHFRALDHCRIEHYLTRFKAAFGPRLLALEFEALTQEPTAVLAQICNFLEIEPLGPVTLDIKNSTGVTRAPGLMRLYNRVRVFLSHKTINMPWLRRILGPLSRKMRAGLLQKGAPEKTLISPETAALIAKRAGQ